MSSHHHKHGLLALQLNVALVYLLGEWCAGLHTTRSVMHVIKENLACRHIWRNSVKVADCYGMHRLQALASRIPDAAAFPCGLGAWHEMSLYRTDLLWCLYNNIWQQGKACWQGWQLRGAVCGSRLLVLTERGSFGFLCFWRLICFLIGQSFRCRRCISRRTQHQPGGCCSATSPLQTVTCTQRKVKGFKGKEHKQGACDDFGNMHRRCLVAKHHRGISRGRRSGVWFSKDHWGLTFLPVEL